MKDARKEARALLEQYVAHDRELNGDWALLFEGLRGALRGDAAAAETLWRVFKQPGFACSNSCHEVGLASLGLALLGVREARPFIERGMPINLNAVAIPLALELLSD